MVIAIRVERPNVKVIITSKHLYGNLTVIILFIRSSSVAIKRYLNIVSIYLGHSRWRFQSIADLLQHEQFYVDTKCNEKRISLWLKNDCSLKVRQQSQSRYIECNEMKLLKLMFVNRMQFDSIYAILHSFRKAYSKFIIILISNNIPKKCDIVGFI